MYTITVQIAHFLLVRIEVFDQKGECVYSRIAHNPGEYLNFLGELVLAYRFTEIQFQTALAKALFKNFKEQPQPDPVTEILASAAATPYDPDCPICLRGLTHTLEAHNQAIDRAINASIGDQ